MEIPGDESSKVIGNHFSRPLLCSKDYGTSSSSEEDHSIEENIGGKNEACADVAVNAKCDTNETSDTASARSGSSSPDLRCPICLGQLENRSFTDTCFHKFCFVCLVEWSKVKAVCPLCKQPFTSVIHSVRSYEDFEQLPVTQIASQVAGNTNAPNGRDRFRYQTTVIDGTSLRRQREQELLERPSRYRHRGQSRFNASQPPPAFTSAFRRAIYRDSLWVQTINGLNRYRDVSAAFFARNPACTHRLIPWLNRELMALLRNASDVSFMLDVIMDCLKRFDIGSESFHTLVLPFLGARTRHFMHEFNSFARSPFDMSAYDTRAVYARVAQDAAADVVVPIEFSDNSSHHSDISDDDSDVVEIPVVERETIQSTLSLLRSVEADKTTSSVRKKSDSARLFDKQLNINQSFPVAGPSSYVRSPSRPARLNGTNALEHDESDGEVAVVAIDKPWRDRSPIVLSSSSDGESETALKVDTRPSKLASGMSKEHNIINLDDDNNSVSVESIEVGLPVETINTSLAGTSSSRIKNHNRKHKHIRNDNVEDIVVNEKTKKSRHTDKHNSKHRHRHHHRHHQHTSSRSVSKSSHIEANYDDVNIGSQEATENRLRIRNGEAGSLARSFSYDSEQDDNEHVSPERPSIKSFISVNTVAQSPLENTVLQARVEQWTSENSSDDDKSATPSHNIRSAVVVPSISHFKKHSSGHKRSEISLPS